MPDHVATREFLPGRRASVIQKARVGGQVVYLDVGFYPDGRVGEIFLDCAKAGSALRMTLHALAMMLSVSLQHGVPLPALLGCLEGAESAPQGPVQGDASVDEARSVLDWVARHLAANYPPAAPLAEEKVAGAYSAGSGV